MEKHIHKEIKKGCVATFTKEPSQETLNMVIKMVEKAEKVIICQMCGRHEHCNGDAGYPEGCFHPNYNK